MKRINLSICILALATFAVSAQPTTHSPAAATHKAAIGAHVQTASLPFPICTTCDSQGGTDFNAAPTKSQPFLGERELMASDPFPICVPTPKEACTTKGWWD